jgi:hypothetical protein
MERLSPHSAPMLTARRRPLWLAAYEGRVLPRPLYMDSVGDANGPEVPLTVEFVGLTEAEQRAALAAFPGGKRFVLGNKSS